MAAGDIFEKLLLSVGEVSNKQGQLCDIDFHFTSLKLWSSPESQLWVCWLRHCIFSVLVLLFLNRFATVTKRPMKIVTLWLLELRRTLSIQELLTVCVGGGGGLQFNLLMRSILFGKKNGLFTLLISWHNPTGTGCQRWGSPVRFQGICKERGFARTVGNKDKLNIIGLNSMYQHLLNTLHNLLFQGLLVLKIGYLLLLFVDKETQKSWVAIVLNLMKQSSRSTGYSFLITYYPAVSTSVHTCLPLAGS